MRDPCVKIGIIIIRGQNRIFIIPIAVAFILFNFNNLI
jgi:hypothetical protein